uniref:F-actin monooxygenase n=2 Tax=Parascaris univalens TaxID=6257 RepID=A0A915B0D0_PARUN
SASSFTKIQQLFYQLCALHDIDPYDSVNVYKSLREKVNDWRAKKLWSQLDRRAEQKEYCGQKACTRLNVLVIGAGPCGLRSAIECALLGANVILVEQRDRFSRNNVLHIWPFVIQDLKNLGIKIFYPTFCRGSIDHISIRQLQCVLLKVALVLGVKIHDSVTFQGLIFPRPDKDGKVLGWRASFEPKGHILSEFIFDALIGADGKRNTVPGFPKREMRGKLAIGITANFVNRRTPQEEKVQEISGVAYIFNQQFFKEMKEATGADLENIVYYKDETHYFVMCAKKQSLIEKGVIIEDNEDVSLLLAPSNVDQEKLCEYAASAADFATNGKLPELKYALNHNGKEDVAMFDFTSLFSAQCSVRLVERYDQRLLMAIVGDTLHEPFWPTGSGCARGFLGVLDTAWMLRAYGLNTDGLMVLLAERESAYRLLAQATPDNLHKQLHKYTIDPRTRYISFEMTVQPNEVSHLVDTDNPRNVKTNKPLPLRVDSNPTDVDNEFLKKYKLWRFCQQSLLPYKLKMYNFKSCWNDGRPLAALLGRYRPDMIDYISLCSSNAIDDTLKKVLTAVEREYNIKSPCESLSEWVAMDEEKRVNYIASIVERFAGDSKRMRDLLINAIRATAVSHKRKAHQQVDASRAKKSEPIQQRASELLNALSSTSVMPIANANDGGDRLVDDFLEGRHGSFHDDQIREALIELNDDEEKRNERHTKRLKELNERIDFKKLQRQSQETNAERKHWTKRPQVDKLNPERIYAVEKIVTGEVEAEKTRELYRNKRRQANILTRKMDRRDIDEMESKLEQTGMGVLFNREQYRVLSSKEEKIMSANAAAARQLARDGFKAEDEKYKGIDERLSRAENLLKNQSLAGVDTVSRMRINGALNVSNSDVVLLDDSLSSRVGKPPPPPLPPKRLTAISPIDEEGNRQQKSDQEISVVKLRREEHIGEARRRPTSMPVMEMSYDSVNARRQHSCQLCSMTVYLAERMQVEGMFIHRKCFRCAFCEQPLRLGHCAQDRNLEKYNPRFYCMQHINMPIVEKIARLEKLDSRTSTKLDLSKVSPVQNTPSSEDGTSMIGVSSTKPNSPIKLDNGDDKNRSVKVTSELKELNSPAALLEKTIEKMRVQREAIVSMVSGRISSGTPERVEFENFKRNLRADLNARKKEQQRISEGEYVSTDDEIDSAVPFRNEVSGSATSTSEEEDSVVEREHVVDDDISSSDEDEFMEADLVELEKTVLENINRNLNETLTDEQAIALLRSFNLRRTSTPQALKVSPEGQSPNVTTFFTPRSTRHTFRSPSADAYCTPQGSSSAFRTPLTSPPKASIAARSESLKSVRERAVVSLADYREKARMRARLKSDEQLGLRHMANSRFSMPVERSGASGTSNLRHRLSLNDHSSRNEVSERRETALVNQMAASDPQTPKTSSPLPHTPTQSDTDIKRDSEPISPCSPSGRGLLARLFPPDPRLINKESSQASNQKNTMSAPLATDEIAATSLDDSP